MEKIINQSRIASYFAKKRIAANVFIEDTCLHWEKNEEIPHPLSDAMAYSVKSGGKRLRFLLTMLVNDVILKPLIDLQNKKKSGENVESESVAIMKLGLAIELIHTFSLIHDDLPAMDNDDLRRGKPTTHIAFSEDIAILAGDALQCEAFLQLSELVDWNVDPKITVQLIQNLATCTGAVGMCGGQSLDVIQTNNQLKSKSKKKIINDLQHIHNLKTGKLISFSLFAPAIMRKKEALVPPLMKYGEKLGLAFQIKDDLLDDSEQSMGREAGSDTKKNKITFKSLLGMKKSHDFLESLREETHLHIAQISKILEKENAPEDIIHSMKSHLKELWEYVTKR